MTIAHALAPVPGPGAEFPAASKQFTRGTHRLIAPEDTVARARRLMPLLGITRVANVTGLDTIGVPVVMVIRPNARSLSVAQGKGLTVDAARASGLMEAIESYHAEHITLPLKLATYHQLCFTHPLIDLVRLPRYANSTFHGDQRVLWIEGQNLFDDRPLWLPYDLVHTDFTLPLPPGSGHFVMTSSGLASGNHLGEAISHGLCELIERDATTLWHFSDPAHKQETRVDLATIDDPACRQVLDIYERAGITTMVWDITSDIGVAAFRCAIVDRTANLARPVAPAGGMGCHPAREIALLRALTEAAQSRVTVISGARDDLMHKRLDADRYVSALDSLHRDWRAPGPRRSFLQAPTRYHDRFADDIAWELDRLAAAGCHQAVCVDLTKPELGVPVVRVVVPGLEILHDIPGYAPGPRARAIIEQPGEQDREARP